jgi:hypothetical protein
MSEEMTGLEDLRVHLRINYHPIRLDLSAEWAASPLEQPCRDKAVHPGSTLRTTKSNVSTSESTTRHRNTMADEA